MVSLGLPGCLVVGEGPELEPFLQVLELVQPLYLMGLTLKDQSQALSDHLLG